MRPHILRQNPTKTDDSWVFEVPQHILRPPRPNATGVIMGKLITFNKDAISITMQRLPPNRVLRADDPSKFALVSFGGFRLPDTTLRESAEYILRFLTKGLFLNGVQYRFYHHSNSQLVRAPPISRFTTLTIFQRGRSCFLREAQRDEDLDERIYAMGDFGKIMNVAKREYTCIYLANVQPLNTLQAPNALDCSSLRRRLTGSSTHSILPTFLTFELAMNCSPMGVA